MIDQVIYEKLRPIFDDVFDAGDIALAPETTAEDVDGWDSLNHVRLILAVRKSFNVKFSAHEIGGLENVSALACR